jgi:hypothetical protein
MFVPAGIQFVARGHPQNFVAFFATLVEVGIVQAILEVNLNSHFPHLMPNLGAV